MLGFMLIQLASLKVGSMRIGYTAAASFTTTSNVAAQLSALVISPDSAPISFNPEGIASSGPGLAHAAPTLGVLRKMVFNPNGVASHRGWQGGWASWRNP